MSRLLSRTRPYRRHGLTPVIYAARQLDAGWHAKLGPDVGMALRTWRSALIMSLGGESAISAQERALARAGVALTAPSGSAGSSIAND